MTFYIDFDYTLFDNYEFRQGLYKILRDNGLDKSYIKLTPELSQNGQKLLNVKEVFNRLSIEKSIPLEKFLKPLEELYLKCPTFLYDDSIEFLKYLRSIGAKICILTWGEKNFQKEKIKASGLCEYIDEIRYAEKLKYTYDDIDYKNGIFIDDSPRDCEGLYKKGGEVYRVIRTNGKNSDRKLSIKEIPEVHSLLEIINILKEKTIK